jgi:SAM-dependent methyltransferase
MSTPTPQVQYSRSAQVYDLIYAGSGVKDYAAEASRLDDTIRSINPKARTLLDVACGTGLHLAELQKKYTVEGVDLSEDMLAVARQRLPGVRLGTADMRTLDLGRQFDAVTCLFSSIGYMHSIEDLNAAFAAMARHLNVGGVLVVDGWVRPGDWQVHGHPDVETASDGVTTVVRVAQRHRKGNITTLDMHHLLATKDSVEYFVEHHDLALMETDDYLAAATNAGLAPSVEADYLPGRDRIVAVRQE